MKNVKKESTGGSSFAGGRKVHLSFSSCTGDFLSFSLSDHFGAKRREKKRKERKEKKEEKRKRKEHVKKEILRNILPKKGPVRHVQT